MKRVILCEPQLSLESGKEEQVAKAKMITQKVLAPTTCFNVSDGALPVSYEAPFTFRFLDTGINH